MAPQDARAGAGQLSRNVQANASMDTRVLERQTDHRPWPLPSRPWIMFQSWQQLLFMHWRVPLEQLRPMVPAPLLLEAFDGSAWVGLVPFRVVDLYARMLPRIPGLSTFPEMNLRTYVRHDGRSGVFFFTLEAASLAAVIGARTLYALPYHHAKMRIARHGEWIDYRSRRTNDRVEFIGRYRPTGPVFQAESGTLEYFLTERYALFTVLHGRRVLRGDIHHLPWPLQPAEAHVDVNTVLAAYGLDVASAQQPLLHYAERQDTLIWLPRTD